MRVERDPRHEEGNVPQDEKARQKTRQSDPEILSTSDHRHASASQIAATTSIRGRSPLAKMTPMIA